MRVVILAATLPEFSFDGDVCAFCAKFPPNMDTYYSP